MKFFFCLLAATKKKFWNPKKWFKRKNKNQEDAVIPVEIIDKDVIRSRSTSELSITEDQVRRRFVILLFIQINFYFSNVDA